MSEGAISPSEGHDTKNELKNTKHMHILWGEESLIHKRSSDHNRDLEVLGPLVTFAVCKTHFMLVWDICKLCLNKRDFKKKAQVCIF